MPIDEPPTPWEKPLSDAELSEEGHSFNASDASYGDRSDDDGGARRGTHDEHDEGRRGGRHIKWGDGDEGDDGEFHAAIVHKLGDGKPAAVEVAAEQREDRRVFEQKRKSHYNEMEMLRRFRETHKDGGEEEEEDRSGKGHKDKHHGGGKCRKGGMKRAK